MHRATLQSAALLTAILGAGCGSATPPSPPGPGTEAAGPTDDARANATESPVRFELIADVDRVAPGQELTLGARFVIDEGWHIYWRNPGDSGLATELALEAPAGVSLEAIAWPGPERFDLPGGVVNYGYEDVLVIPVTAGAPDRLQDGLSFSAEASWLACRESCVRGSASAELEVPAATAEKPARPTHQDLFRAALARMPTSLGDAAKVTWREGQGSGRTLVLEFSDVDELVYFPAADEGLVGAAAVPTATGQALHLTYSDADAPQSRGLIAVTAGSETRYHYNDVPWTQPEPQTEIEE